MGQMGVMAAVKINAIVSAILIFGLHVSAYASWACEENLGTPKMSQTLEGPCGLVNLKLAFGNNFINANFFKAKFMPSSVRQFHIENVNFNEAKLDFLYFYRGKIKNTQFRGSEIKGTRFVSVYFKDVNFSEANLAGTQFINCQFESVEFKNSNLRGTLFQFSTFINTHMPVAEAYFMSGSTTN